MTKTPKRCKLSHEILRFIGISAGISLVLFWIVSGLANGVVQEYCFNHDIHMTEFDWMDVERWIFSVSAVLSCVAFSTLFLFLLGDQIAYIHKITAGIDALRSPEHTQTIPLEGNNELTDLAAAINNMSAVQRQFRDKEQALAQEKEDLIRSLSHDIRTPLTSILAYSDYLTAQEEITPKEQLGYMQLIRKKAEQIRDLTAILLDGSHRNPEFFDNGRLLMEQIAAEFQEELEEKFAVTVDLTGCSPFSCRLDVQELRRIFDNLSSNVRKYADPVQPVTLSIRFENTALTIRQTNAVLPPKNTSESYRIGLNSIRRIAQYYEGSVATEEKNGYFTVFISLSKI